MKFLQFVAVALLMTVGFSSCKKDKDEAPVFVMEGKWTGNLSSGSGTPTGQFAMNAKSGGVFERLNSTGSVAGTGTWSLSGNSFVANYTLSSSGTVINLTATLEKASNKLTGSWTNDGGGSGLWNATHD
jgi:hypothetical protein